MDSVLDVTTLVHLDLLDICSNIFLLFCLTQCKSVKIYLKIALIKKKNYKSIHRQDGVKFEVGEVKETCTMPYQYLAID